MRMPRHYATGIGLGFLALALVAGCGSGTDTSGSANSAAPVTSATTPEAEATPAAPATPTTDRPATGGTRTTGTNTVHIPTDPGGYGDALIAAWASGDAATVERLAAPAAAATLSAATAPAGLMRTACEDDMCSWATEAGKRVTMTFDTTKVADAQPQAVTEVKLA